MKNKFFLKKKWIVFLFILLVGSFLRLYKVDQIPPGVNRDEASIGYTAFSLLQTNKDEYGRTLPASLQSFGDWKLPFYIYADIPFIKIFGLNELAVRLPSALAGIATIGLTFFLTRYFFVSDVIPFMSMILLSLSPWHIHLSRVGSEANVAVFFMVVALLFFFKALKQKPVFFVGSALFFALTYFTYHGNHITTTLLLIGLLYFFKSKLHKSIHLTISFLLFLLVVGFILVQTLGQADKTKISGISIFGNPAVIHEKIEIPRNQHDAPQSWSSRLFHNRVIFAAETIGQNYLKSFSPEFLFIRGGTNHAHNIENFGNLYLAESVFFYLGIIVLFLKRKDASFKFLLWWLIISPIAASITKDAPHTTRMFAFYPLPPILIALGIERFLTVIPKKLYLLSIIGLIAAYSLNVGAYLDRYFVHFPINEGQYWGKIYAALYQELSTPKLMNKKVVVSHPEYSPYIFFLFYSKYDPAKYQETALRYPPTEDAFVHVKAYDRFTFREVDWNKNIRQPNTVFVDFTKDIPASVKGNHLSIFTLVEIP